MNFSIYEGEKTCNIIFQMKALSIKRWCPNRVKSSRLCGTGIFLKANRQAKLIRRCVPFSHSGATGGSAVPDYIEISGNERITATTPWKRLWLQQQSFMPPVSVSAADDFNDLAQTLLALDPAQNSRYKGGDIGFGRLYADVYKDIARYVPERKKWYIFNGQR